MKPPKSHQVKECPSVEADGHYCSECKTTIAQRYGIRGRDRYGKTSAPMAQRKQKRRRQGKAAKQARKANRA